MAVMGKAVRRDAVRGNATDAVLVPHSWQVWNSGVSSEFQRRTNCPFLS